MTDIFISHATADKKLAQQLVKFLKEAVGVPESAIFCTSLKGHGIPFAEDFNAYMRMQIQEPKLVLLLMTESYMNSAFCLMELGASWAKSLNTLPIIIPPVSFDTVTKTLGLRQAWKITDHAGLIDLRSQIVGKIQLEPRDEHTWEEKRRHWKNALPKTLRSLATQGRAASETHPAPSETHPAPLGRTAEQASRIKELERELANVKQENSALIDKMKKLGPRPPTVLIIESDILIAEDIKRILLSQGQYLVIGITRSRVEALAVALQHAPDIVIAETQLADGDSGIAIVNEILSSVPAIPMFVTAYPERLLSGPRPEQMVLVTKPFQPADLLQMVKQAASLTNKSTPTE